MQSRDLDFRDTKTVGEEIDRLHKDNYEKTGSWDLAQACNHLTYFIEGSLDGHPYRVPWFLKVLFGRLVLHRILKQRRMKPGGPTPQKPLPLPGDDEAAAVAPPQQTPPRLQSPPSAPPPPPLFPS